MRAERKIFTIVAFATLVLTAISANCAEQENMVRGKYLIETAGCNDCHTAGYAASGAVIPEPQWLLGDGLGFRGSWGTTYAINLRKYIAGISEDEWGAKARNLKTRPPMPWWSLNAMTEEDLKAIYDYIKELGPAEHAVPDFVPPEQEPKMPYVQWPMS